MKDQTAAAAVSKEVWEKLFLEVKEEDAGGGAEGHKCSEHGGKEEGQVTITKEEFKKMMRHIESEREEADESRE